MMAALSVLPDDIVARLLHFQNVLISMKLASYTPPVEAYIYQKNISFFNLILIKVSQHITVI